MPTRTRSDRAPKRAEAIHKIVQNGGRYLYEETFGFQEPWRNRKALKPNYVQPYAGSSAPLHQAVLAFTSPTKPFVTADPGYEAGERAAAFIGAKVIRVPLTKTYAHDVKAMAAAEPDAGLIYVCNPNNPTGTLTPRADIEWLLENKPKGSILLLDEAYIHIAGAPDVLGPGGEGQGHHHPAHLLQDLRHGRTARGRGASAGPTCCRRSRRTARARCRSPAWRRRPPA